MCFNGGMTNGPLSEDMEMDAYWDRVGSALEALEAEGHECQPD